MTEQTAVQKKYSQLPTGEYLMTLDSIEKKVAKTGAVMMAAKFKVVKGAPEGHFNSVFRNFIIKNSSDKAIELGKKKLSEFLQAVGEPTGIEALNGDYSDLALYKGKEFIGACFLNPSRNPDYAPTTEIGVFKPL